MGLLFLVPAFVSSVSDGLCPLEKEELVWSCRRLWFDSWVRKISWRSDRLPTPELIGFPAGSAGKESACNAGDLGLISGLGRSPGGGRGNPAQHSCLETPHGQRSLGACSPRVAKSPLGWAPQHSSTPHEVPIGFALFGTVSPLSEGTDIFLNVKKKSEKSSYRTLHVFLFSPAPWSTPDRSLGRVQCPVGSFCPLARSHGPSLAPPTSWVLSPPPQWETVCDKVSKHRWAFASCTVLSTDTTFIISCSWTILSGTVITPALRMRKLEAQEDPLLDMWNFPWYFSEEPRWNPCQGKVHLTLVCFVTRLQECLLNDWVIIPEMCRVLCG